VRIVRYSFLTIAISVSAIRCFASDSKEDLGFVVFRDNCMACHLQSGMGIKEMNAPSIAGLPRWYVTDQLRKFRRDQRGYHSDDAAGNLMQANALALDERSIAFVGRHIESLAPNENRATLALEARASARSEYERHCAACHGEKAQGDRAQRVPPLTSQQDWYLLGQVEKFAEGKRPHTNDDPLENLDSKTIESIAAWISSLPAIQPK